MTRFHFHIYENGQATLDSEGRELTDRAQVRREAVETSMAIAREAFLGGDISSGQRVVINVDREDDPFLKVSVSLEIEEKMDDKAAAERQPRRLPEAF